MLFCIADCLVCRMELTEYVGCSKTIRRDFFSVETNEASARISRTLPARPNHRSKWNVPNQCLSPPPPQVLGRWHDGPAWPKFPLGQWARHFGLLSSYRYERHSPPTFDHLWIGCRLPLLNLCDAHGIVVENPFNLLIGFHLAIAKLLAEFNPIPLLESFRHFLRMQRALRRHCHSHAGCMRLTLSASGKKSPYAHEGTFHFSATEHLPCLISSAEKNHVGYFLYNPWTLRINCAPCWFHLQDNFSVLIKGVFIMYFSPWISNSHLDHCFCM